MKTSKKKEFNMPLQNCHQSPNGIFLCYINFEKLILKF